MLFILILVLKFCPKTQQFFMPVSVFILIIFNIVLLFFTMSVLINKRMYYYDEKKQIYKAYVLLLT